MNEVDIVRIIVNNSVEQRVVAIQERKRKLASSALTYAKRSKEQTAAERFEDLRRLFMVDNPPRT